MKKSLLVVSVVASVVLLSGCGNSGGGSKADTVAPKFNFSTYSFDTPERKVLKIPLSSGIIDNDKNIVYTIVEQSGNDASIVEGSKLQFSAGSYKEGSSAYKVKVVATDSAKNASVPQEFIFNIKKDLANGGYALNPNYVAKIGNKNFTKDGGYLKDPSGLLWNDKVSESMDYVAAKVYCKDGWRLPTRDEFLNIIDYTKGNSAGTKSLIDSKFTYSADNLDASWVEATNSKKFVINHKSGADTQEGIETNNTVLCVYGTKATTKNTGLEFTTPDTQSRTYQEAKAFCDGAGYRLPTINELRSAIDYKNATISMVTVPNAEKENYYIWSSTEWKNSDKNDNKKRYFTVHMKDLGLMADIDGNGANGIPITHFTTCVKK